MYLCMLTATQQCMQKKKIKIKKKIKKIGDHVMPPGGAILNSNMFSLLRLSTLLCMSVKTINRIMCVRKCSSNGDLCHGNPYMVLW